MTILDISFTFLGDNIFIVLVFVLYIIKTRFTQNTCISWFLMLDLDFFRFHQAQGTRLRWHMCRRALFSVTTSILSSSEMTL